MDETTIDEELLSRKAAQCLELMRSSDMLVRDRALAELKQIPTESMMDVLLETRRRDRAERNRATHMDRPIWQTVLLGALPVFVGTMVLYQNVAMGMLIGVAGFGALLFWNWKVSQGIKRNRFRGTVIHQLLNNSNNPRTAFIHAEIFRLPISSWPDREPFASAVERLIQFLPEITQEHNDALEPRQRVLLRGCLYEISRLRSLTRSQARLATAMVQYAANVGDLEVLRAVKSIAARRSSVLIEQQMIEQAHISMGILQDLQHRIKQGETMLRPSTAPNERDATLLRSAQEMNTHAPETQLLRADIREEAS